MATVDLTRTEPAALRARIIVRYARNPGIVRKEAHVHSEYAARAIKSAIPRVNAH